MAYSRIGTEAQDLDFEACKEDGGSVEDCRQTIYGAEIMSNFGQAFIGGAVTGGASALTVVGAAAVLAWLIL